MALSGVIQGSCDNSHYTLACEWSATQSIANNTSTITAKVYLNGNGWATDSSYWNCWINGTQVTTNKDAYIGGKTLLGQKTWTVSHNANGSLSTTISFSYSNGLTSAGTYTTKSGSGSATVTLDTIPRVSSFSLNTTSGTLGSTSFTINISRASSSFTHTVSYQFGNIKYDIATKTGNTRVSFTPEINDCAQIPNSTSGTGSIVVTTYNGSTQIGSTSKNITLNVPSSVVPSTGISVTVNNALSGVDVAGRTTYTVSATNAKGSYGSTIKSYQITGGGLNSGSSSATTTTLGAGTYTFTVKVTDSRGRTASATSATYTMHSYSIPSCSMSSFRADSNGNASSEGTHARAFLTWNIKDIASAQVNAHQYAIQYKQTTWTNWSTLVGWTDTSPAYSGKNVAYNLGGNWNAGVAYEVKFLIRDSYNTVESISSIPTIDCMFDIETSGCCIGGLHQGVAKMEVNGNVASFGNGKQAILGTGSSDCYVHNTNTSHYLQFKDDGTLNYTGTFTQGSDARFKEVHGTVNYSDAHSMVKNTEVYTYTMLNYNKEKLSDFELQELKQTRVQADEQVGLMAQDIENYESCQNVVIHTTDKDGDDMLSISHYGLIAVNQAALKEEIKLREEEIARLENKIEELTQLVQTLLNKE